MTRSDVRDVTGLGHSAPQNQQPSDWPVLRSAVLASLSESPDAFLATASQLKVESTEFWRRKLMTASWAVVQRGQQTLGIAAAKPPSPADGAHPERACFIESVWIAPELRKHGVGERLVTFLIEQQRQAGILEFYLWVFSHNGAAIRLYDRMDFKPTGRPSELPEIQFLRKFDSDVIDEDEIKRNRGGREADGDALHISYRMLSDPGRRWLTCRHSASRPGCKRPG
jgi:ribosomal protein S18 acetylase RimI-like enzyme